MPRTNVIPLMQLIDLFWFENGMSAFGMDSFVAFPFVHLQFIPLDDSFDVDIAGISNVL